MFEKGQLVVCVDDRDGGYGAGKLGGMNGLTKGVVYTIKNVGIYSTPFDPPDINVWLEEIVRGENPDGIEAPFAAQRFRPLPSSQISLVNSMLVTKKTKEPVLSGEQGDAA